MKRFLKDNALFESMLVGIVLGVMEGMGWMHLDVPGWVLPGLLFWMLFFTFCKINPLDLRLHRWHWIILAFQVVVSIALFYAIKLIPPHSAVLAQGIMICVLMPSATAAPIIAGKLGGSIETLTSYTLLSNTAAAFWGPALFPVFNPALDITFMEQFLEILKHIAPLLVGPFVSAWLFRVIYNAVKRAEHKDQRFVLHGFWAEVPFWLWVMSLVVLMDKTTIELFEYEGSWMVVILLFVGAFLTCVWQFNFGKRVGEKWPSEAHGKDYKDVVVHPSLANNDVRQMTRISAGQALGQKNTSLAVWLAQVYLLPVASIGPAAYILWQNLFNAWQLARAAKGKRV